MSIYDDMDEATRDKLYTAAEQLERMTDEQLELLLDDVQTLQPAYQPESDILMIFFGVDSDYGITGWELEHNRGTKDGEPAKAGGASEIETIETVTRGTWNGYGTTALDLFYPPEEPLDPQQVVQDIYNTLIHLIGVDEQTLLMLTTPPTQGINIRDSPTTEMDVLSQQGPEWEDPIVVTEEMRAPDPENHIDQVPESDLPRVLSDVDAGTPMTRFQCDRRLIGCVKSPVEDQEDLQSLSRAQDEEYRNQLAIREGEQARGIAVITDTATQSEEKWTFSKIFHPECGPTPAEFESKEDELNLHMSKGKDEVYIEGTISFGQPPSRDEEIPHQPVYFEDITVLGRRGEYAT